MFQKVLIANRGAIACRILRTLRRLGIAPVAVYSEADRHSLHVQQAAEAVLLGPAPAAESYLEMPAILAAARQTGAEAIHPGYGFLSENAAFAEACAENGIVFIGPTPAQMRDFGPKHTARRIAEENGLPLLPGTGLLESVEEAREAAGRIGYPVMLKSTAGGGGIGMRVCHDAAGLADAYTAVQRLSRASFGAAGLYLEKFVARARHIEVQIFGDGRGAVLALGERDCSVQRRHQKVIEETPAPGLSQQTRTRLLDAAVRLGKAVRYRSAGTVEFLYDDGAEAFYFLEVNTRLQVEHGVTEEVTGVDLVEWMVRQAAGELPALQSLRVAASGCAMQARVYAEDPGKDFQPSSGRLLHVQWPAAARVETWVEAGAEVTPYYDPMLAKIIVRADSREAALERLRAALAACRLDGIETNLEYLRQVCGSADFQAGGVPTAFLSGFGYTRHAIDVLTAGTQTTVQDYPGRLGYWHVGVPPSGPMDALAFRLANRLVGNPESAAGLEITVTGPTLRFRTDAWIALTGADFGARLEGAALPRWQSVLAQAGSLLELGTAEGAGVRGYLAVAGGLDAPDYLGSAATFILGRFGGCFGRVLRPGDVLPIRPLPDGRGSEAPGLRGLRSGSQASEPRVSGSARRPCGPPKTMQTRNAPMQWNQWLAARLQRSGCEAPEQLLRSGTQASEPGVSGSGYEAPEQLLRSGTQASEPGVSGSGCEAPEQLLRSGMQASEPGVSGSGYEAPGQLLRSGTQASEPRPPGSGYEAPEQLLRSGTQASELRPPGSGYEAPERLPRSGSQASEPRPSGSGYEAPEQLLRSGMQASELRPSRSGYAAPERLLQSGSQASEPRPSGSARPAPSRPSASGSVPIPTYSHAWDIGVLYGPHGAPDFFTPADMETFFATAWKVHHNSDRTGVRLIGPKPRWARPDGGEAGLHPSNIHDNAYAVGTIDFTGDMPVILGPDGPSLGGFVCPATIIDAELWKVGQLKPGDLVRFRAVSLAQARRMQSTMDTAIASLEGRLPPLPHPNQREDPVLRSRPATPSLPAVVCRADGDQYLLLEYGPNVLDLNLRFRVHALESQLRALALAGIVDITPGVRSLHIHYDGRRLTRAALLEALDHCESRIPELDDLVAPSRTVHLPLSWDDPATRLAIRKYINRCARTRPGAPATSNSSGASTALARSRKCSASSSRPITWCSAWAMSTWARRWPRLPIRGIGW